MDIRLKAVELVGELFALPRGPVSEHLKPLFTEFMNRLTDTAAIIRISVIKLLKRCLMLNHCHLEASEIISKILSPNVFLFSFHCVMLCAFTYGWLLGRVTSCQVVRS